MVTSEKRNEKRTMPPHLFDENVCGSVDAVDLEVSLLVDGDVGLVVDVPQVHVAAVGAELGLVTVRRGHPDVTTFRLNLNKNRKNQM